MSQTHQLQDESLGKSAKQTVESERAEELKDSVERIREGAPSIRPGRRKRVIGVAYSASPLRNGL